MTTSIDDSTIVRRFLDRGLRVPTELHLGELFADLYRGRLWWVRQERHFFEWDGRRFRNDESGDLALAAAQTLSRLLFMAAAVAPEDQRKRIAAWAVAASSDRAQRALLRQAAPTMVADIGDFDRDPALLNCRNGTIDLRSGEIRPHTREDLITQLADVDYEPDGPPASHFEEYLQQIFEGDLERIDSLHRLAGHSATGETREHILIPLNGPGGNGKGTFVEVMGDVLGDYWYKTPMETFLAKRERSATNDLAKMHGKRMVVANEINQGRQLDAALVKDLTGADSISARFLFKEFFTYRPKFKIWLVCNYLPVIDGSDEALQRRLRVIPFRVRFAGASRDKELRDKLQAERAGILAWVVSGAVTWYQSGLGESAAIVAATRAYTTSHDRIGQWIAEDCLVELTATIGAGELRRAYVAWCRERDIKPDAQSEVAESLERRGFRPGRSKRQRFWSGLRLRRRDDLPEDDDGDRGDTGDTPTDKVPYIRARRETLSQTTSPTSPLSPAFPGKAALAPPEAPMNASAHDQDLLRYAAAHLA